MLLELTKDEWEMVKNLIDEKLEEMMPYSDMFPYEESCLLSMLNKVKILHEYGKMETIPETCGNCCYFVIFMQSNTGGFTAFICKQTHVEKESEYRCDCGKFEPKKEGV